MLLPELPRVELNVVLVNMLLWVKFCFLCWSKALTTINEIAKSVSFNKFVIRGEKIV